MIKKIVLIQALIIVVFSHVYSQPVELLDFHATTYNSTVQLKWSTAKETNNDFFTVDKSMDYITYQFVGQVAGAGTSNHLLNYSLQDFSPYSGLSYYRLSQTDFNGTITYLGNVPIEFIPSITIILYPNPVSTTLNVQVQYSNMQQLGLKILIYDNNGNECYNNSLSNSNTQIDVSTWNQGIYYYLITGNIKSQTGKFVKL